MPDNETPEQATDGVDTDGRETSDTPDGHEAPDEVAEHAGGKIPAGGPKDGVWRSGPVWLLSERPLARFVGRPIAGFLRVEAAGGIVLLAAALVAMAWANSPWSASYADFWHTGISLSIGPFTLADDLQHWVNDALMAVFFLVVGLEIKQELVSGQLRDPRQAALPIAAAIGGMAIPAATYAAFNGGGEGSAGWGIPMATDIAFALGVLAVLGRRIPPTARVFLLTLAIVDDIGAITVIALFYTDNVSLVWLGVAAAGVAAVVVLRRMQVWSFSVYLLLGVVVWLATYQSGVHATIAGVVMGLLAPAKPLLDHDHASELSRDKTPERFDAHELSKMKFLMGESVSVAERLEHALHPWSAYVILPVFALANAGIELTGGVLGQALQAPVTIGVAVGLVIGKTIGITAASWLAVRLGLARRPDDLGWSTVVGLAMVAGIGFTVSLFVTGLAFDPGSTLEADAKVGVLGASLVAAVVGALLLVAADGRRRRS